MSWNRDSHRRAHVARAHANDVQVTLIDISDGAYAWDPWGEVDRRGDVGLICAMCEYVNCACRPFQGLFNPEPSAIAGPGWKLDTADLEPIVDDDLHQAVAGALQGAEGYEGIQAFYNVLEAAQAEQRRRNAAVPQP